MSVATDFFLGGGGSGVGLFPNFPPKRTMIAARQGGLETFGTDGRCVILPATSGQSIEYYNATGSSQATRTLAATNAAATAWLSFQMDEAEDLLYIATIDDAADRIYLHSINTGLTSTLIGSAVVATNLNDAVHGWTAVSGGSHSGASMFRAQDGSGDFTIRASNTTWVISSTTGALISEVDRLDQLAGHFESTSGVQFSHAYVSNNDASFSQIMLRKQSPADANVVFVQDVRAPDYLGFGIEFDPGEAELVMPQLQWKGHVAVPYTGQNQDSASMIYDITEYTAAVDQLVENLRTDI